MVGAVFVTAGVWGYREARGEGQNDLHDNGLELETLVWTHIWLNIDTDGYIAKYL